jgi:hypothetical protein
MTQSTAPKGSSVQRGSGSLISPIPLLLRDSSELAGSAAFANHNEKWSYQLFCRGLTWSG